MSNQMDEIFVDDAEEDDDDDDGNLVDGADSDDDDVDDVEEFGATGNLVVGAAPRDVLEFVARNIVDEPDGVFIEASEERGAVTLQLHVAPGDMGKVIGKRGRIAQAIRQVVRAAGAREGVRTVVDIVD